MFERRWWNPDWAEAILHKMHGNHIEFVPLSVLCYAYPTSDSHGFLQFAQHICDFGGFETIRTVAFFF